jgi:hypothetical protein
MKGYQKISRDIFGDSGYHLAPYPGYLKQISQDILLYPKDIKNISHPDILHCYPVLILCYPILSYSNIPMIFNHISKKDLKRISFSILIYPHDIQ